MQKILVIDDEPAVVELLGSALRKAGYSVVVAPDGECGMRSAREFLPDLVICDLEMPGMHGFEVLTAIRVLPGVKNVAFIFLTGATNAGRLREGMNLGADDFLIKPVRLKEILGAVRVRLSRREREREVAEQRVTAAMATLEGILDDLRGPVLSICGVSNQLRTPKETGAMAAPKDREVLRRIERAASSMQKVLADLNVFAHLRLEKRECARAMTDVRSLLNQLVLDYNAAGRIRFSNGDGNYRVEVDAVRVRRAVESILVNALVYSEREIEVKIAAKDEGIVIVVSDRGRGIPEDEQARVFEPFFRGSNVRDVQGGGLGLAIARSFMAEHDGTIEFRSTVGVGTEMTVRIPARNRTEAAETGSSSSTGAGEGSQAGGALRRFRAIIVDDDELTRTLLRSHLQHDEVDVVGEAGSLEEARQVVKREQPEAVFLDIGLPDGMGLELLRDLKRDTRVVFVTGAGDHAISAFDCDAVDYILKPVTRERLSRALQRVRAQLPSPSPVARAGANPLARTFLINTLTGQQVVKVSEIKAISAYGEYTRVYWGADASALLRKPLKQWEKELVKPQFVRVHRNGIVNLAFLERVTREGDGSPVAHIRNMPAPFKVSVRLQSAFRRALKSLERSK